jgi:membrane protein
VARKSPDQEPSRKGLTRLAWPLAPWIALAALLALWPRGHRRAAPGLSVQARADPAAFEAAEPGRGRLAEAPTRIPPSGWPDILWRTVREVQEDRVPRVAASVTFYTLLALFPALGVFVSLYGMFADVETAREQLIDRRPP